MKLSCVYGLFPTTSANSIRKSQIMTSRKLRKLLDCFMVPGRDLSSYQYFGALCGTHTHTQMHTVEFNYYTGLHLYYYILKKKMCSLNHRSWEKAELQTWQQYPSFIHSTKINWAPAVYKHNSKPRKYNDPNTLKGRGSQQNSNILFVFPLPFHP